MYDFLSGAVMFGSLAAGTLFLRAYARTRDRLFVYFALSFFVFAVERLLLVLSNQPETSSPFAYVPRLLGFTLIIVAIVEKNRSRVR